MTDEQIEKEMAKKIKKAEKVLKWFHIANAALLILPLSSPIVILNFVLAKIITAAIMRLTAPCSAHLTTKKYNKIKYYQCNINAYELIINKLKEEVPKCSKSKKPEKCKLIVNKQIEKLKEKQNEFHVDIVKEENKQRMDKLYQ